MDAGDGGHDPGLVLFDRVTCDDPAGCPTKLGAANRAGSAAGSGAANSGCGCTTAGRSGTGGGWEVLGMLTLGLVVAWRHAAERRAKNSGDRR
jgi:MYXO-CTERM domain-containing protein